MLHRSVRSISAVTLVMALLGAPATARAQSTTEGAIAGVLSDASGGRVPGAVVTARNLATNSIAEVVSDETGRFLVIRLQPGVYEVQVVLSGFTPVRRQSVIVEVGRVTNLDVSLVVGGQTETVQVTADTPLINTTQSDFSTNIDQTSINNLPTNTRRWSTFALMTPGAAPDGNFGLISFRGISGLLNGNTVDGGDNTQAFFAEERGRTRLAYSVSVDAIQEFQVTTSNYSAEYGRAAGGVVNAVTKSGTNQLRGSGFYFIRDNKWGASNPFQTRNVLENGVNTVVRVKPDDRRQQFGATLGGPIVPDRLFFFLSYDQQVRDFPGIAQPSNPAGFFAPFSAAELTTFASRGVTPEQQAEGLAFLQGLTGEVNRSGDQTLFLPKIDWRVNDNHSLSVTYNRLRWDSPAGVQTAAVVFRGMESWGNDGVNVDWTSSRLTSILNNRMTNEVRFQWGRDFEFQTSQPPLPGQPVSATGKAPLVTISGVGGIDFGTPDFLDRRSFPDERRVDIADTFTFITGTHFIKTGAGFSHVRDTIDNLFRESGVYAYNNRVDFISDHAMRSSGAPLRTYTSFQQGFGPPGFELVTYDYDAWVQDTWNVAPQLTLNLGLRYEYQKMPDSQIANPLLPASSEFPSDRNNFGPRLGAAYDITGRGSTVIRGGYGIFYGRIINSTIFNAIGNVGSADGQLQLQLLPAAAAAPVYPDILASASLTPVRPDVVVFRADTQNPLIHEYDLVFEQKIADNTIVSVAYVGSAGRNLPLFVDTNLPPPATTVTYTATGGPLDGEQVTVPLFSGVRPDANFSRITEISYVVESKYDALVLQLNRRLHQGLQVQASYTEARATDGGQTTQTFTASNNVLNPYDLGLEDARSTFEVRRRFVASAVWNPSFGEDGSTTNAILSGLTISPAMSITSGLPYTGLLSGNVPAGLGAISTGVLGAGGTNRLPSIPRNDNSFPSTANVDLRVSYSFRLGSQQRVEILGDVFNLFNKVNYTAANTTMYTVGGTAAAPTLTYNQAFGTLTNANSNYFVFTPRQVQIGIRYSF